MVIFLGVKCLDYEADHSTPSSAEVKKTDFYLRSFEFPCGLLLKHRDFTFYKVKIHLLASKEGYQLEF